MREHIPINNFNSFDDLICYTYSMTKHGLRVTFARNEFIVVLFPLDRFGIRFTSDVSTLKEGIENMISYREDVIRFRVNENTRTTELYLIKSPSDLQEIIDYYHLLML